MHMSSGIIISIVSVVICHHRGKHSCILVLVPLTTSESIPLTRSAYIYILGIGIAKDSKCLLSILEVVTHVLLTNLEP